MQNPGDTGQTQLDVPIPHEMVVIIVIRQYFQSLRQEKGNKPDASPLDLEFLLLVKWIAVSDGNTVDLLRRVGIILVQDKIVINGNLVKETLVSSRSRINNTLNKLGWDVVQMKTEEKFDLLTPLLDRADVRNWTIRMIPQTTALYQYVMANPSVQFKTMTTINPIDNLDIGITEAVEVAHVGTVVDHRIEPSDVHSGADLIANFT